MSNEDLLTACAGFILMHKLLKKKIPKRKKRLWVKPIYISRMHFDANSEVLETDHEFETRYRMTEDVFNELLDGISAKIEKKDTNYRSAITSKERLKATLDFLMTGNSYSRMSLILKISKQSLSVFIPEVCSAIVKVLEHNFKIPQTEEGWLKIARQFEEKWNFPHCVGSLALRDFAVQPLLVAVDADYNFIHAGVNSSESDSEHSSLIEKLTDNIKFLPHSNLKSRKKEVPYVFVGNEDFPFSTRIMNPYCEIDKEDKIKSSYNEKIIPLNALANTALDYLSTVFKVLQRPMLIDLQKAELVIMASIHLHNYLKNHESSRNIYMPNGILDYESRGGSKRQNSDSKFCHVPGQNSEDAEETRTEFAEYLFDVEDKKLL